MFDWKTKLDALDRSIQLDIENMVKTMLKGRQTATVTEFTATELIGRLVSSVRKTERANALMSLMTVEDVAEYYGVTPRRIRAKAQALRERGVNVGYQVPGTRAWLFSRDELENVKPMSEGRPRRQ